ncbi:RING-type E3 ubiquitin transferase [Heracleum sosnowskyi]|uniref:E3 ubiquitin-protein ligase RMA n=1 Tax=Heracleum sosnowskyi TaxID=360622 RepID=A0AAD8JD18_9APIA|nr:RING-type E3 ubiquitin transferase [Heracleum sosnowskyi]
MDGGGDDMRDVIDLNLDPDGSRVGLRPLISELESAQDQIEVRIRRLEEVMSRLRQRRTTLLESGSHGGEGSDVVEVENTRGNENEVRNEESGVGSGSFARGCKRDYSQLVAKALEDVDEEKKDESSGGSFYDCNICLEMAKDPVLTCCGHLFCWPCFYQLEYVDLTAKECPVCRGDVVDSNVTPIYGSANSSHVSDSSSGVCIPPRPRACRVESIRQRVSRPVTHVPVAEALRRIRMGIGATTEQLRRHNQAAAEQRRQQIFGSSTAGADLRTLWMTEEIGEWQPLWRDAEIGGSRHENVISPQITHPSLDTGNAGLDRGFVTDLQLWMTEEIRGHQHDNATGEQARQQNDNASTSFVSELPPLWMTSEIGSSSRNNGTVEQPRQQNLDNIPAGSFTGLEPLNAEIGARRRSRSRHIQRVLSETAASLSSISIALNNTERDLLSNSVAVIQTELQSINSTAETNVAPDASAAVVPSENLETASSVSDHLSAPRRLSSRRSFPSMLSETENDVPRESQRRRMR